MSTTQKPNANTPAQRKNTNPAVDPLAASAATQQPVAEGFDDLAGASEDVRTLNADLDGDAPLSVDDEVALVSDQMSGEYIGVLPAGAAGLFGGVPAAAAAGLGPLAALAGLAALAAGGDDDTTRTVAGSDSDLLDLDDDDPQNPMDANSGLAGAAENFETIAANNGVPNGDNMLSAGIESFGAMAGEMGGGTPLADQATGFEGIAGSTSTDSGGTGLVGGGDTATGGVLAPLTSQSGTLTDPIANQDPSQLDQIFGEGGGALAQDAILDLAGPGGTAAPAPASSNAGAADSLIANTNLPL